jgi:hypothetical protein
MLNDDVAIGHSGEVITDGAVQAFGFNAGSGLTADFFGVFRKISEEFF